MAKPRTILAVLLATAAGAGWARAGEIDVSLEVQGELRLFPHDAAFDGQFDAVQPSLAFTPEIKWETEDRDHQVVLRPFVRLDAQDGARTHGDIREAYYRHNADRWSATVGLARVFWGRTESRHLVDIVNQTDAVEDIDEEDKLGQPMVNVTLRNPWGAVDLFLMTGFRDRTFPGRAGRLRFDPPVDVDNAIFEADARRLAPDVAVRYAHYLGPWDFGIAGFFGTSREARFAIDAAGGRILPVYDRIAQGSIDFQYTKDALLLKFEGLYRAGHGAGGAGEDFFAAVGGFEYTLYQVLGSGADIGLLGEFNYDGRDQGVAPEAFADRPELGVLPALRTPVTIFDNDAFAGARLALNDAQDTSLLAGVSVDVETGAMASFAEFSRRLGSDWRIEAEARLFFNAPADDIASVFADEDFLTARLIRFF